MAVKQSFSLNRQTLTCMGTGAENTPSRWAECYTLTPEGGLSESGYLRFRRGATALID